MGDREVGIEETWKLHADSVLLLTRAVSGVISGIDICLWLWGSYVGHERASVSLRPLQTSWPNKMDAKAVVEYSHLGKLYIF